MAQGAALKEVANGELRCLLAYKRTSNCADIKIGGSALSYNSGDRTGAPQWGGSACIQDIDETGASARYPGQTFEVARYRVR